MSKIFPNFEFLEFVVATKAKFWRGRGSPKSSTNGLWGRDKRTLAANWSTGKNRDWGKNYRCRRVAAGSNAVTGGSRGNQVKWFFAESFHFSRKWWYIAQIWLSENFLFYISLNKSYQNGFELTVVTKLWSDNCPLKDDYAGLFQEYELSDEILNNFRADTFYFQVSNLWKL